MAHKANLYKLITVGDDFYIVSDGMMEIIKVLKKGTSSYQRLAQRTGLTIDTLYIFCRRLEKAKILKRTKVLAGKPLRLTTVLALEPDVVQRKMKVLL